MLQKTRAIVLHAVKYGDSSLIVQAYTEQWGRISMLLKGARKSRKSNRAVMFQPLYLLDLDIYYRDNREMHWIREAVFSDRVQGIHQDLVKSAQAIFLSEVLLKTIREEEKNPELFGFLQQSIQYFDAVVTASPSFHILFLFRLTRYLGFYPGNNFSADGYFFNTGTGLFSATPESLDLELETKLGEQWHHCFSSDYHSVDQLFSNHEQRNLFLDSLLRFYRRHHPSMKDLRSTDVLRTVFG
jgi:DNA repair protein RecO (recombination protein O)